MIYFLATVGVMPITIHSEPRLNSIASCCFSSKTGSNDNCSISIYSFSNDFRLLIVSWMDINSSLSDKYSFFRFVRLPIVSGKDSNLLLCKYNSCRFFSCPIVSGKSQRGATPAACRNRACDFHRTRLGPQGQRKMNESNE